MGGPRSSLYENDYGCVARASSTSRSASSLHIDGDGLLLLVDVGGLGQLDVAGADVAGRGELDALFGARYDDTLAELRQVLDDPLQFVHVYI